MESKPHAQFRRKEDCLSTALVRGAERIWRFFRRTQDGTLIIALCCDVFEYLEPVHADKNLIQVEGTPQ